MATCNGKFLADIFNLSIRRVEQLCVSGHVIKKGRGRYDLLPSVRGYINYLKELARASEKGLTEENRKIKELKRLEIEGKLLNAEELKLEFAKLFTDIKTHLLAVRHKCSQEITHILISGKTELEVRLEINKILEKEHYGALVELSQWGQTKKGRW